MVIEGEWCTSSKPVESSRGETPRIGGFERRIGDKNRDTAGTKEH